MWYEFTIPKLQCLYHVWKFEFWEWISNSIRLFLMGVITYPCYWPPCRWEIGNRWQDGKSQNNPQSLKCMGLYKSDYIQFELYKFKLLSKFISNLDRLYLVFPISHPNIWFIRGLLWAFLYVKCHEKNARNILRFQIYEVSLMDNSYQIWCNEKYACDILSFWSVPSLLVYSAHGSSCHGNKQLSSLSSQLLISRYGLWP